MSRPTLLLHLAHARDPQRMAVGPALAAAAGRAGWSYDCYHDELRAGRHFGGGEPADLPPGWAAGSLVVGGRHADHLAWIAARARIVALGDPASALWPALDALGAEALARTTDPVELLAAALERAGLPAPPLALVLDGSPQGPRGLVLAPYLYPALLGDEQALALDVSSGADVREGLEALGVRRFEGLYVDPERAARFPGGLDASEGEAGHQGYAAVTASLARRHAAWGRGILLGDPALVAAQLARAARLRLLPLYGRPQTAAIEAVSEIVARAQDPVFGRQFDDHDFFAIGRLGKGLQVVDPGPPLDALRLVPAAVPDPPAGADPSEEELRAWAREGRVLVTLLFWAGMVREIDCVDRLIDIVATSGVRGGLVVTTETLELGAAVPLASLALAPDRGGVHGLLEPLLGSTGRGVSAEGLMPPGALAGLLAESRARACELLPPGLHPRGWWPLLDTGLVAAREPTLGREGWRPVVRYSPVSQGADDAPIGSGADGPAAASLRGRLQSVVGRGIRASGADVLFAPRRPYGDSRPGPILPAVVDAARAAGFEHMWTKAAFGSPRIAARSHGLVALPLTAGGWDGWSPFYTIGSPGQLASAERRLLAGGRGGWLASNIDSPLWTMSGEFPSRGADLWEIVDLAARGGRSGRLVPATPSTVARYARVLAETPFAATADAAPARPPS